MSASNLSNSHRSRLELSSRIKLRGSLVSYPCDHCIKRNKSCLKMSGILKCSECARRGKPCVSLSWEALDRSEDRLSAELREDERKRDLLLEQLSEMQSRVNRKRKVLEQTQRRASEKLNCLVDELRAAGDDMTGTVIDASALEAELLASGPVGTAAEASSSQGSG